MAGHAHCEPRMVPNRSGERCVGLFCVDCERHWDSIMSVWRRHVAWTCRFPKDTGRRLQWFANCRRDDGHGKMWQSESTTIFLCSRHFTEDCFQVEIWVLSFKLCIINLLSMLCYYGHRSLGFLQLWSWLCWVEAVLVARPSIWFIYHLMVYLFTSHVHLEVIGS